MKKEVSTCIDCGLPCVGYCKYYNRLIEVLYCDECGEESETLYYSPISGRELCEKCILNDLDKVE